VTVARQLAFMRPKLPGNTKGGGMRKVVMMGLLVFGFSLAQQETPPQVEGFPEFAPPPSMFTVTEEPEDGYLVDHKLGETLVPKNPQRIVALEQAANAVTGERE
jgi:ABC-type enterochelin transport system substrate-binding protein